MMNKHQTLIYLKYGRLVTKINEKITDSAIKSDMIKFLIRFPGTLKQPEISQFKPCNTIYKHNNESRGRFKFEIIKSSKMLTICVDFDGINNFQIFSSSNWPYINTDFYILWASIDKIKRYVECYQNDFNDILRII